MQKPFESMGGVREDAEELQQEATAQAHEARRRMREATETARRAMRDAGERTVERSRAATEEVRGFVRKHPIASLAIGLGAGMLVSQIFRRRR